MAIKVKNLGEIRDVTAIKWGNNAVHKVYCGSNLVWPVSHERELKIDSSTITVYYVDNHGQTVSEILASGDNTSYAYITATVREYEGTTLVNTYYDVWLTPSFSDVTQTDFYIDSTLTGYPKVRAHNLGTTEVSTRKHTEVYVNCIINGISSNTYRTEVYQQTNTPSAPSVSNSVSIRYDSSLPAPSYASTGSCTVFITNSSVITWTSRETSTTESHIGTMNLYYDGTLIYSNIGNNTSCTFSILENRDTNAEDNPIDKTHILKVESTAEPLTVYREFTFEQDANYYSYSDPIIYNCHINDIPASGGTEYPTWSYVEQTYGWGENTSGAGIVRINYGDPDASMIVFTPATFSGIDLLTDLVPRTKLGTITSSSIINGKRIKMPNGSGGYMNVSIDVYQAENSYDPNESHTYDVVTAFNVNDWRTSGTACDAEGGQLSISYAVKRVTEDYMDSGHTRYTETNISSSAVLTISGNGLSIEEGAIIGSTKTLKWANRETTEGAERSGTVTITSSYLATPLTVTVYQKENYLLSTEYVPKLILSNTAVESVGGLITVTALGYTNYQYDSGYYEDENPTDIKSEVTVISAPWYSINASHSTITVQQNSGWNSRTGMVRVTWQGITDSKEFTQEAGSVCPITATITPVANSFSDSGFWYTLNITGYGNIDRIESAEVQFRFSSSISIRDDVGDFSMPPYSVNAYGETTSNVSSLWNNASAILIGTAFSDNVEIADFTINCTITPLT